MEVRLELRHLRLVQAVAEEGSVTAAGRRLHLTQSALSHQLKDAEERLGAPLFLRLQRRMLPTPAGERLLASARRILADLKRTEDEILGHDGPLGTLRLSTECYTCYHWLPPVLKRFHRKFARVDVAIDADQTSRVLPALLEGRIDLGICSSEPHDPKLRVQPLFEDEMLVVMAPKHPLAKRPYVRAQDLAGETLLAYSSREDNLVMQRVLVPEGIEPRRFLQVRLTEVILEMVKAGLGVSALARWAVAPQLASGALAARPLGRRGLRRQWSAVTLRAQEPPGYLKEFIELVATQALPAPRRATA